VAKVHILSHLLLTCSPSLAKHLRVSSWLAVKALVSRENKGGGWRLLLLRSLIAAIMPPPILSPASGTKAPNSRW
jgi:hypothetical protein